MDIGRVGIWTSQLDYLTAPALRDTVQELEGLGYGALWFGENIGREPLTQAGLVLAATDRMVVATGIANIWARDPLAMVAAQATLAEAHPDRFLLGLGVSHERLVGGERGHEYGRPLGRMREYLDGMDRAALRYRAPLPEVRPRVLAALGPRMLALAAARADGAHTYFVPPEHTAEARAILGPDKLLAVEQAVVLDDDPGQARVVARRHTRRYLPLDNYVANLRRLGFDDADFEREGSDRLVDAVVACGDVEAVARRVEAHWQAGASHVCLQVIVQDVSRPPGESWAELATALL